MLKFLLLLVVVLVAGWMFNSRRRVRPPQDGARATPPSPPPPPGPTAMLACAHCGVHVPQNEVVFDAERRTFCSEAHSLAGPR